MFCLVAYDIVDNNRRHRLFKALRSFGVRAQLSLFECDIPTRRFRELLLAINHAIDENEDDVRVYRVCNDCFRQAEVFGKAKLMRAEDVIVI